MRQDLKSFLHEAYELTKVAEGETNPVTRNELFGTIRGCIRRVLEEMGNGLVEAVKCKCGHPLSEHLQPVDRELRICAGIIERFDAPAVSCSCEGFEPQEVKP